MFKNSLFAKTTINAFNWVAKKFTKPKPKVYVIGDIHGMYDKLLKLKKKLPIINPEDKVIFLGDYIDRGPDSFKVLENLYNWQKENPNVICLKGNHEDMMVKFLEKYKITDFTDMENFYVGYDTWFFNDGESTIQSFVDANRPEEIRQILTWVKEMPVYHKIGNYNFSHSGYNAKLVDKENMELTEEGFLWSRDEFLQYYHGEEKWFVGHSPTQLVKKHLPEEYRNLVSKKTNTPFSFNNITLMDTGSFRTASDLGGDAAPGKISCLEITTNTLFQA